MEVSRTERSVDLQLCRDAVAGITGAWHEFVERYSGLILSIVRRYLADFDDETARDAYVDVLECMHSTGLAQYDGRAALSTWVMAIARSRALDMRRALHGRRREPTWLASLKARDREVFHLYFERGESIATIREAFAARGEHVSAQEIARSLDRLDGRMDRRLRTRLAYDLHARSVGAASGSFLGFVDHIRLEQTLAMDALRPDLQLAGRETDQLLGEMERLVQRLDVEDRAIVELHFYRRWTAQQIARELGLRSQRRAYSRIGRAVANLRRAWEERRAVTAGHRAPGSKSNGGNR